MTLSEGENARVRWKVLYGRELMLRSSNNTGVKCARCARVNCTDVCCCVLCGEHCGVQTLVAVSRLYVTTLTL
jgi:hypothetical protein